MWSQHLRRFEKKQKRPTTRTPALGTHWRVWGPLPAGGRLVTPAQLEEYRSKGCCGSSRQQAPRRGRLTFRNPQGPRPNSAAIAPRPGGLLRAQRQGVRGTGCHAENAHPVGLALEPHASLPPPRAASVDGLGAEGPHIRALRGQLGEGRAANAFDQPWAARWRGSPGEKQITDRRRSLSRSHRGAGDGVPNLTGQMRRSWTMRRSGSTLPGQHAMPLAVPLPGEAGLPYVHNGPVEGEHRGAAAIS